MVRYALKAATVYPQAMAQSRQNFPMGHGKPLPLDTELFLFDEMW